jgi:hypothetical protein
MHEIWRLSNLLIKCDKVCQWLAAGRWFSLETTVSSTNKSDRNVITEILLTEALNTITLTLDYERTLWTLFQECVVHTKLDIYISKRTSLFLFTNCSLCEHWNTPAKVVSSNPAHGEVYSIQLNVIKFVSDLRQVGGFLSLFTNCHLCEPCIHGNIHKKKLKIPKGYSNQKP